MPRNSILSVQPVAEGAGFQSPPSDPWAAASVIELRLAATRFLLAAEAARPTVQLRALLKASELARGLAPGSYLSAVRQ